MSTAAAPAVEAAATETETTPDCPAPSSDDPTPTVETTSLPCVVPAGTSGDDDKAAVGWVWPGVGLTAIGALGLIATGRGYTPRDPAVAPPQSVGPERPAEPARPQEPSPPTDPSLPADPARPTEPAQPGGSTGPTDPHPPGDSTPPENPPPPEDPTPPKDPIPPKDPTPPEEPHPPSEPPKTDEPTQPVDPGRPGQPVDPLPPADPVATDPAPLPPPPFLALADDGGLSTTDRHTRDARVAVSGLASGAIWQFSLDRGQTWREGQGDALEAALFTRDGLHTVLARQTDAHGTSAIRTLRFVLHAHADTPDLSSQPGPQAALNQVVDRAALAAGIALTATAEALTLQDLHELRLRLGGDGFDPLNDRLHLDRALDLNRSAEAEGVRIGGLEGLAYRYDAATASLAIWRADGSAMTGSEAAALTNAIRLNNLQERPREGERTVTLSVLDVAGNLGAEARVSVTVDSRVPTLDFNGVQAGLDADIVFRSLDTPRPLLPDGAGLQHANPDASFQQVTIEVSGSGASRDDVLGSQDGGTVTAFDQTDTRFTVAGATWQATRVADGIVFRLDDGAWASAAQTQALLESLMLGNAATQPLEGARQFKVTVTDHLGRTGSATSVLLLDTTPPLIDFDGTAAGRDVGLTVASGVPIAVPLGTPTKTQVAETSGVVELKFRFTSAVAGALAPNSPSGPDQRTDAELFGFYDRDKPDQLFRLGDLGHEWAFTAVGWVKGLLLDMACTRPADGSVVVTITPNMTLTADMTNYLLEHLAYRSGVGPVAGLRQLEIIATDRAGNVGVVPTLATLDVKPVGTPVVLLGRASDTGVSPHDGLTSANGSAASPMTIGGYAAADATLTLFRDANGDGRSQMGEELGTVVADSAGRWQYQLSGASLADGTHHFGAVANGLTSGLLAVTVDTTAPDSAVAVGDTVSPRPVVTGTTEAGAEVTVEFDTDGNPANGYELRYLTRADADGHWRVDTALASPTVGTAHRFEAGDTVHLRVLAADRAGNLTVRTAEALVADTQYRISDAQVIDGPEGSRQMVFTVSRSGDLSEAGSVRFAVDRASTTASQSADELAGGLDFSGPSAGALAFASGESSKTIRFTVHERADREADEQVAVRLEAPIHGAIDDGVGLGRIEAVRTGPLQGVADDFTHADLLVRLTEPTSAAAIALMNVGGQSVI